MHSYDGAVQRAGVFAELPAVLSEAGIDPREVFDGTGISLADLRHSTRVPLASILSTFHAAALRLGCPHVGLIVGARFTFEIHGPIGRLMRSAETLEQAIFDFVTWQQGYSTAAVVYFNKAGDGAAFGYGAYDRTSPGSRQLYDCVMAVACRMISDLTQDRVRPVEVLLSQRRPDDVQPYLKHLKGRISFDQPQACVILDRDALRTPLASHDPLAHREALDELEALASRVIPNTSTRVAHQLKPLLHIGDPELGAVAAALNLHPRTLRRRLKAEGVTFEAIRDKVRFTLARELLDMTDLPIGAIGDAVAFSTHGAFLAAFRRWTGMTPSAWRKERTNLVT